MKKIEENLIELLEVFDGNGIPNNIWVKDKLEETLIAVKNCSIPVVVGRSEQLCKHKRVIKSRLRMEDGKSRYCKDCQEWLT